jgi:hypothetical protein
MGVRLARVLYCCQEHGLGEQTYPHIDALTDQDFITPRSAAQLRREARKVGWTRDRRGNDYCEGCTAIDAENNS